jgi:hypothetical protein
VSGCRIPKHGAECWSTIPSAFMVSNDLVSLYGASAIVATRAMP